MKASFRSVFIRFLLLSSGLWLGACGEKSGQADAMDSKTKTKNSVQQQEQPHAQETDGAQEVGEIEEAKEEDLNGSSPATEKLISEFQNEIESERQNIEDIEAFAQMERAKLEKNPDYDSSFLLEALDEQEDIRENIKDVESRLKDLTEPGDSVGE